MAIMNVNPTRMQLTKLKKQLTTAVRGHKMLKDKRDELMRQFLDLVRENRELREKIEKELSDCNAHFVNASAVMSKQALDASLMSPKQQVTIDVESHNIMSVETPVFTAGTRTNDKGDIFPYGFAFTSFELDDAVMSLEKLLPENIKQILGGDYDLNAVKGIRLIPCNTVKGSGYIAAFRPDRITAELGGCKKRINALIGVDKDLFEGEGFDAILNPKILI